MRPTKPLGDASRPPSADPGVSLLLIAAILAPFVAVAHPVGTAGLVAVVGVGYALQRTVRVTRTGYLCVPRFDRCVRVVPA